MSEEIGEQIEALKQSIAALTAQQSTLGDDLVNAALLPLKDKLSELERQQQVDQGVGKQRIEQQRKQVTVLFTDIGDSTPLVNKMDPEDAMEVFDTALKRLGKVVEAQGGHVTRYQGDGLMAVFGTPVAREDDPQRAVRVGLDLVEEAKKIGDELGIPEFGVRVGVNTGLVAVGGQTEAEDTLMGSAINLAARLESAAPVGSLLISHDTYRNVRGLFEFLEIDPVLIKGFTEPVQAYCVLRAKTRSFHQLLRGVEGLETRMVGRDGELNCLQEALINTIETGEGQVITVSGEAGVGKSRLLEEFQNWIEQRPEAILPFHGRGWVEGQGQPYSLLREVFADRFEIQEDDNLEAVREKFVRGLQQAYKEQAEMKAHLLGQMLGYGFKDSPQLKAILGEGEQLHNRGIMYLGEFFMEMSRRAAVVMLLEDIHWADDSTLDAINWLEQRMGNLRMLIVCGTRESLYERRPYWGEGEQRHTRVILKPLTKRESRRLVEQILHNVTLLPDILRDLIVESAEGNPFYLEELVKMLIEDGVIVKGETEWRVEQERLQITTVPSTLTGVLQARLDSLPSEELVILQEASVVGRQFWDQLVAYMHSGGKPEFYPGRLQELLTSLRGRELIFRRETSAFAKAREYLFKHDLLREVTYGSVLMKVRRAHHSLVADWLIANAGGRMDEYVGLIGEHLVLGGRGSEAVDYLLNAGDVSLRAYSNRESEGYYRQVLTLNPSEVRFTAALQGLGNSLTNQGRCDEAVQVLQNGVELSRTLGDQDRLAQMYYHLAWSLCRVEYGDTSKSWPVCQQAVKELEAAPDSPGLARLLSETGRAAYWAHQPKEVVVAYCQLAIEMAQRLGLVDVQVNTSITLGLASPDIDAGIRMFTQAASQAEAHGLDDIAARAYSDLGLWKTWKYDFKVGLLHKQKALDLYRKTGAVLMLLNEMEMLVLTYIEIGEMQKAPLMVAEVLEGINVPEQRARESQLFISYILNSGKGEWEQALGFARLWLREVRRLSNLPAILSTNSDIIHFSLDMAEFLGKDDLSEAKAALRENKKIMRENPSIGMPIYNLYYRARVEILGGRIGQANLLLAEGETLIDLGNGYQKQSRDIARYFLAKAERRWDDALAIAQSLVDRYQESEALWYLARNRIYLGDALCGRDSPEDRDLARQTYQESMDLFFEMGAGGYVQVLQNRLDSLPAEPN